MSNSEVMLESTARRTSRVTREQQALAELGITRWSRGVPAVLVIVFLLTIVAIPLFENISDVRTNIAVRRRMLAQGVDVARLPGRRPRSLDILNTLPSWQEIVAARGMRQWVDLLPKPTRFREYEDSLILTSGAIRLIRPGVQWFLTGWLGTGSEKVIVGRDGWLFYRDGVQYITGPGFLNPEKLGPRSSDGQVQPDPGKAIVQFHNALSRMGISLVVLPIPDKAMIRPASFSPLMRTAPVAPQNPSWQAFRADLQQQGVSLLDLTGEMFQREKGGSPQFLRLDSHWSPVGADVAARALADYLTRRVTLPPAPRVQYSRRQVDYVSYGDLVALLNLPLSRAQAVFPREQLVASQVVAPSGVRWQPDPTSDVLLIGDSFLDMYSTESAGIAEQLSYYLQRPVDRIAGHLWGAYGAREAVGKDLQHVREGVGGRKVVIWEFAMRNLAVGGWKLMD